MRLNGTPCDHRKHCDGCRRQNIEKSHIILTDHLWHAVLVTSLPFVPQLDEKHLRRRMEAVITERFRIY